MKSRLRAALSLYAFAALGVFLLVAPWTPVWSQAIYALLPAPFRAWLLGGWVRGLVSGLGFLDLIVALRSAVELTDASRGGGELSK